MNKKEYVFKALKKVIKSSFNENSLIKEIGIDSLDLMEIIIESEVDLGISILDGDLKELKRVKDIVNLLEKYLK